MRTLFPTRQVMPPLNAGRPSGLRMLFASVSNTLNVTSPSPVLFQFLKGLDDAPKPMSTAEISALGDIFTREILLKESNPLTLRALLTVIGKIQNPALLVKKMFLIAEGATFRNAPTPLELNARLVFTWQSSESVPADVMLSTVAVADDPTSLLQLIAWSEQDRAFHYFERKNGAWAWAGNSFHALDAPTRGQGPFDSHINGSLVMKELKRPWTHWHSMNSSIPREVFGKSEFNTNPIFEILDGGELLENIVRTGVRRWTKGRIAKDSNAGSLANLPKYFRQILWCTSVNLASSRSVFSNQTVASFDLPSSFFFDVDAFSFLADELGVTDLIPPVLLEVDAALYRDAIQKKGVRVCDDAKPLKNSVPGDTHFAFLVPERAFEDQTILNELVVRGVLSPRLALCLLMVDFTNPVFSPDRAALLRHIPDQINSGAEGTALDKIVVDRIRQANTPSPSPEAEFLQLWDSADLTRLVTQSLSSYAAALVTRLQSRQGIEDLIDLADSRRQAFADKRSLAEFNATLAHGQRPPAHLAMRPDGSVFTKASDTGEGEL